MFELPLNFQHDCDLSYNFYALQGVNDQYFGFVFDNAIDKKAFTDKMRKVQAALKQPLAQIRALKNQVAAQELTYD